jgi:sorting nexin-8
MKTDVSVEQVALLAQQNTLPEPTLDISMLSYSTGPPQSLAAVYSNHNHHPSTAPSTSSGSTGALRTTATVPLPPDDPWAARHGGAAPFGAGELNGGSTGPPSSVAGTGLPAGWWKRLEKVTVQFAGQQGFVLNRYMMYGVTTEVRRNPRPALDVPLILLPTLLPFSFVYVGWTLTFQRGGMVHRRYSEFTFLWDCLVRRYPFRLLPQLPPKRIGRT